MLIVAPSNNTFAIEAVVVTISLHCLIGGGEAILVIAESLGFQCFVPFQILFLASGRISSSLGNLSKLLHLDISLNELQGELPISIGNLHSLEELDLSANFLSSEWPISIGNLSSLKELDLSQNISFGELPISMGNLGISLN
ncbi:hypothetical protein WN943_006834 [Citrus x changshan-huyou]